MLSLRLVQVSQRCGKPVLHVNECLSLSISIFPCSGKVVIVGYGCVWMQHNTSVVCIAGLRFGQDEELSGRLREVMQL